MRIKTSRLNVAALAGLAALIIGAALPGESRAQDWPTRPVTMVVPFGPGASNDAFTRQLADRLSKNLGQPFTVDNRAGAGGFVGSNAVSKATPDGYMFLENSNGIVSMGHVQKNGFDTTRDLVSVGMIARSPSSLLVAPALGVNSVAELIAYAKANPEKVFFGSAGIGTSNHLHGEQFNVRAGVKMKHVPYKSFAEVTTDLVAGRVHVAFSSIASVMGQVQSGQIKLLAYAGPGAPADAPKAPTLEEAGVKNFEAQLWWGIFAPPGTPAAIVKKMNAEMNKALSDPTFAEFLGKAGATPAPMTAENFAAAVKRESDIVDELIKTAGLKFE